MTLVVIHRGWLTMVMVLNDERGKSICGLPRMFPRAQLVLKVLLAKQAKYTTMLADYRRRSLGQRSGFLAISRVNNTLSEVSTSTISALMWLLVLIWVPNSVLQSVTSHSRPCVVIIDGLPIGMIPTFSVKCVGPTGAWILFCPFSKRNITLCVVIRYKSRIIEGASWEHV